MKKHAAFLSALLTATAVSSSAGGQTKYEYDALGRLVAVEHDGSNKTTVYSHDELGNRISIVQAASSSVEISVDDASVDEGGDLVFLVTRSAGSLGTAHDIDYATADGTATSADYTSASGTLAFGASDRTKTITVSTTENSVVENNETVLLNLSNPTNGASIGDSQGVGTVLNDDSVSFSINDASEEEGVGLVFTITKTGSSDLSHDITYASADGTATAGVDYTSKLATRTFTSTQYTKTLTVGTMEDTDYESDETLYINLSNATNSAVIADSQGLGTIENDDSANNPPTAVNDNYTGVNKSNWTTFSVLNNDSDPDSDPLTITSASALSGSVNIINNDTQLSYNCSSCGASNDYITYYISDGNGGSDSATVTVYFSGGGGGMDP